MASKKGVSPSKVAVSGKEDLYHDVKQEKKKKLDEREYEALLRDQEIELSNYRNGLKRRNLRWL
jgi:hypothetical protein